MELLFKLNEIQTKLRETVNNHSVALNETLVQDIRHICNYTDDLISEYNKVIDKNDNMATVLCMVLKTKIGQPIYWAHKDWLKYETHTITDVKYEEFTSDFFDTKKKYKGTMQVQIEVDNTGNYLAKDIGRTLFFDKEEAEAHTQNGILNSL